MIQFNCVNNFSFERFGEQADVLFQVEVNYVLLVGGQRELRPSTPKNFDAYLKLTPNT